MKFLNDTDMFNKMKKLLYSASLSDALDKNGFRNQAMRADIRPVFPEAIVVGRAKTVLAVDVYKMPEEPYKLEIEAIDSLKENDVIVIGTNDSTQACPWGELCSTAASVRGCRGAITDGYTRDVRMIVKMKFPVFAKGIRPIDGTGRSEIIDYNSLIKCGDVLVNPGDIIFADIDGVVVIPKKIEKEIINFAIDKVKREDKTRLELLKGASLKTVFEKYKAL